MNRIKFIKGALASGAAFIAAPFINTGWVWNLGHGVNFNFSREKF